MTDFTIHQIEGYIQTLFLIEYPKKLLLLDSGCRCDVEVVVHYIEEVLHRSMKDLKLVVLTHPHPDHLGGAHLYQKKWQIPIAGTSDLNSWYKGISGTLTHLTDIYLTYYVARRKSKGLQNLWYPKILNLDIILQPQDPLPHFEDWKIIATPGHTLVDTSIYHPQSHTAYIADCIIGFKNRYSLPYPIFHPQQYRQTLMLLKELSLQRTLLAHHGIHQISPAVFDELYQACPTNPKNHRNSIKKRLKNAIPIPVFK